MSAATGHIPVMLREVVTAMAPVGGETYVDATFGAGGYSTALLSAADCRVYAIDRDPDAIARGMDLAAGFGGRLTMVSGCFGDMRALLAQRDVAAVNGIVLDIGVSSFQIDQAERGFSFQKDGPLDMRMDRRGRSAADVVNQAEEAELADIFHYYGEDRAARRVARAVVRARADAPIERTLQLADLVARCAHYVPGRDAIHPATRIFQALRIYVNDELGELQRALAGAEALLATGGRLVVVSFHSLEDRIVKDFLRQRSGRAPAASRHAPAAGPARPASFELHPQQALKPTPEEIAANPRARSARLRCAIRTPAPAWPQEIAA